MQNIIIGRYSPEEGTVLPDGSIRQDWQGWIEPEDRTWIMFVAADVRPVVYLNRDPETGGVIEPLELRPCTETC